MEARGQRGAQLSAASCPVNGCKSLEMLCGLNKYSAGSGTPGWRSHLPELGSCCFFNTHASGCSLRVSGEVKQPMRLLQEKGSRFLGLLGWEH